MSFQYRTSLTRPGLVLMFALFMGTQISWGLNDFRQPKNFTVDDPTSLPQNMSRSTNGQLLWLPAGRLALIYYEGQDSAQSQGAKIIYREWTPEQEWGAREQVNQSVPVNDQPGVRDKGARHPSMALRPDGSVFAVWHDFRNCDATATANLINNIEIYGDLRPAGGHFGDQDLRLTDSGDTNNGDNGYLPKAATLKDGRIALAWYDFHWNLYSEIAVRLSDVNGSFGDPAIDRAIRTTTADRSAGDEQTNFVTPSIAVDDNDTIHLVWSTMDSNYSGNTLYYGQVDPAANGGQGTIVNVTRLRASAAGYYDPAKLIVDPVSGDLWLLCTDYTSGNGEITIQRRAIGAAAFDAPINLTNDQGDQSTADAVIDRNGVMHVAYVDSNPSIKYMAFDTKSGQVIASSDLTSGIEGNWDRPAIMSDLNGNLYIVWQDFLNQGLWFTTNYKKNGVADWGLYE